MDLEEEVLEEGSKQRRLTLVPLHSADDFLGLVVHQEAGPDVNGQISKYLSSPEETYILLCWRHSGHLGDWSIIKFRINRGWDFLETHESAWRAVLWLSVSRL